MPLLVPRDLVVKTHDPILRMVRLLLHKLGVTTDDFNRVHATSLVRCGITDSNKINSDSANNRAAIVKPASGEMTWFKLMQILSFFNLPIISFSVKLRRTDPVTGVVSVIHISTDEDVDMPLAEVFETPDNPITNNLDNVTISKQVVPTTERSIRDVFV